MITSTPPPPYYAAIFTAVPSKQTEGYEQMAGRMLELAATMPGFLGIEWAGTDSGEITVSYWESAEAIRHWKGNAEHQVAQELGRSTWYSEYRIRIAKVEREYGKSAGH